VIAASMKKILLAIIIAIILIIVWVLWAQKGMVPALEQIPLSVNMKIQSPAFENNQSIPPKYTCDGENVSPALVFSEIPQGAKSLVLINDDPDAPSGIWVHWTIWNISPETSEIAENSAPAGAVEGVTSFGKPGFGGSCPPSGTHRYFKLYALDTMLELPVETDVPGIAVAMEGHILAQAELIGLYKRQ